MNQGEIYSENYGESDFDGRSEKENWEVFLRKFDEEGLDGEDFFDRTKCPHPNEERVLLRTPTEDELKEPISLTQAVITSHNFSKWGWSHTYRSYIPYCLILRNMNLKNLTNVENFREISYLDCSENRIKWRPLCRAALLPNILFLNASKNLIRRTTLPLMKHLRFLNLSENYLVRIESINQPYLETLLLNNNCISELDHLDAASVPRLRLFSAACNVITSVETNWTRTIQFLYLADNKIKSLVGIENLVNLRRLHVRQNRIRSLRPIQPTMEKLEYINLRDNKIRNIRTLKHLTPLRQLRHLITLGNKYEKPLGEDLLLQVLVYCPSLLRLNREVVTPLERETAAELRRHMDLGDMEEEEGYDVLTSEGTTEDEEEGAEDPFQGSDTISDTDYTN